MKTRETWQIVINYCAEGQVSVQETREMLQIVCQLTGHDDKCLHKTAGETWQIVVNTALKRKFRCKKASERWQIVVKFSSQKGKFRCEKAREAENTALIVVDYRYRTINYNSRYKKT